MLQTLCRAALHGRDEPDAALPVAAKPMTTGHSKCL